MKIKLLGKVRLFKVGNKWVIQGKIELPKTLVMVET
jgi:hypothetical protein